VIAGIPWYYRQFGYEMAIDKGGGLQLPLSSIKPLPESEKEQYSTRQAAAADIPLLKSLYEIQCEYSLVNCVRDDVVWQYEIKQGQKGAINGRNLEVIETAEKEIIGYIYLRTFPAPNSILEVAVNPAHSLMDVCYFIGRTLKARIEKLEIESKPTILYFALGEAHPAYDALGKSSGKWQRPYAWYVRIPNLARFLMHIKPVLERRLAQSVITGYSGSLKLNFYTSQLKIDIEKGRITAVEPYQPDDFFDFDVFFPNLTFYQVLFGRRDIDDLRHIFPDCYARNEESFLLVKTFFPKGSSHVLNLD